MTYNRFGANIGVLLECFVEQSHNQINLLASKRLKRAGSCKLGVVSQSRNVLLATGLVNDLNTNRLVVETCFTRPIGSSCVPGPV